MLEIFAIIGFAQVAVAFVQNAQEQGFAYAAGYAAPEAMLEVLTFGLGSKVRGATKVDNILDSTKLDDPTSSVSSSIKNNDDIPKYLKILNGKVEQKIPIPEYNEIRIKSIHNPDENIMTLGKYEPTLLMDGSFDWSLPGPNSYNVVGKDTMYFDLGSEWEVTKSVYDLTDADMFNFFNKPALDKAIKDGKIFEFTHDPRKYPNSSLEDEFKYLKENGYIFDEDDFRMYKI